MSANENERNHTMNVLSDMFRNITEDDIQVVCEINNWNLELCVSALLESEESQRINLGFQRIKYGRGAVPKLETPLNFKGGQYNVERNSNKVYISNNNDNDKISQAMLSPQLMKVNAQIKAGYRIMIIMRGAPGSGKTFLANMLIRNSACLNGTYNVNDFIFSTDDYFYNSDGQYKYNVLQLSEAHDYNHKRVREKAKNGWSPIVVDNTNMQLWEMVPYAQAAVQNGYLIELLEPNTPWQRSARRLVSLNTHGVPLLKIEKMLEKYEESTVDNLLEMLKDTKYTVQLPQMRLHPQPPLTVGSVSLPPPLRPPSQSPLSSDACTHVSHYDRNYDRQDVYLFSNNIHTLSEPCINMNEYNNKYKYEPIKQRSKSMSTQQQPYHENPSQDVEMSKIACKTNEVNVNVENCLPNINASDEETKIMQMQMFKKTENENNVVQSDGKGLLDLLKEDIPPQTQQKQQIQEKNDVDNVANLQRHSIGCPYENELFKSLRQIYPNKSVSGLWDLFVKCNGCLDWAVDILLKEDDLLWHKGNSKYGKETYVSNSNNHSLSDNYKCACQEPLVASVPLTASEMKNPISLEKPLPQRHHRARPSRSLQQQQHSKNIDLLELKQSIEKCFVLGDEQYSEHVLKIKNARAVSSINQATYTASSAEHEIAQLSDSIDDYTIIGDIVDEIVQNSSQNVLHVNLPIEDNAAAQERYENSTRMNDAAVDHNKQNVDDDDNDNEGRVDDGALVEADEEEEENIDDTEDSDNEDMLELPISEQTVKELFSYFKDESSPSLLQNMKMKLPNKLFVLMSRKLAKRLYMLCMESLYSFIAEERQTMIQADEDFARLLKSPKYSECKKLPQNVQELLDMEMALSMFREENAEKLEQPKNNQRKDLATHLTEIKLFDTFPNIPRDTILNIYMAHGNSYDDTLAVLQRINSLPPELKKFDETYNNDNNNDFNQNNNNSDLKLSCNCPSNMVYELQSSPAPRSQSRAPTKVTVQDPMDINDDNAKELALHKFEEMRNLAAHHHQLKSECHRKAQEAITRKQGSVASYYSEIAEMHKQKIDMYNQVAANCIREVHKYTQNNQDHLDLHYLYVAEAIESLDIFLDYHITKLRITSEKTKDVYVITGRGRHSATGVSTIKTKVMTRLRERNLKYKKENAGLLKVRIFAASRHSKNFIQQYQ